MEKIKTLAEYQQLASRTCIDLGSEKKNALHMSSGIITEIGEALTIFKARLAYNRPIDIPNLSEETSDAVWFTVNDARQKGISLDEKSIMETINHPEVQGVFTEAATISEEEKTENTIEMYKEFLSDYMMSESPTIMTDPLEHNEIILFLMGIARIWGFDFFQGLTNNIEKLKVRFPEKFTEEAANNRDLDAERKVLEQDGTPEN